MGPGGRRPGPVAACYDGAIPSPDPEKRREASRRWKQKNRERVNARRRELYAQDPEKGREKLRRYRRDNPEKVNAANAEWARGYRKRLRDEMHAAYGDECTCCGEKERMFLQLDHVNNDGAEDRRRHKTGAKLLAWLKRNGWPPGYQVLCANCNMGKHLGGGTCPHVSGQ